MKPQKPQKPRSQVVSTHKAAADHFKITARTLRNWRAEGCPGFASDGTVDLAQVGPWAEAKMKEREGSLDLREQRLVEQIRKDRLANDAKEGRLIERAWMASQIQMAAGEINNYRAKSEAEHPVKFAAAAGDVAACRTIVRGIWDEIAAALQAMAKHFETPAA